MKRILILAYDIPRGEWTLRKRIWRKLKNAEASLEFHSFWSLDNSKSNLKFLNHIKEEIIKSGGKSKIILGEMK